MAVTLAGDAAALILAWFAGSAVMHLAGSTSWRVAVQRGLGLALLSLVALLLLRQALPDLFVLPLVFFAAMAVDIITVRRSASPGDRYVVSILISLAIIGAIVIVDIVLRVAGHHLTVLI